MERNDASSSEAICITRRYIIRDGFRMRAISRVSPHSRFFTFLGGFRFNTGQTRSPATTLVLSHERGDALLSREELARGILLAFNPRERISDLPRASRIATVPGLSSMFRFPSPQTEFSRNPEFLASEATSTRD